MEINYIVICDVFSLEYGIYLFYVTVYHGIILHGVGLILAFLTLKAKSDALNDYHYNTAIIFVSSAFILLYYFPQSALADYVSLLALYNQFVIFSITMLFLGLTFIPKVY